MLIVEAKVRQIVSILIVGVLFAGPMSLGAAEKHWIAHEAQAIVVGTLKPGTTLLWFDGWHGRGVITVDEVLYGERLSHQIDFRFTCKWENHCQWWPPPHYPEFTLQRGLWFLRRIDQNTWRSANGFSDTGFRFLSDRDYWENYIRLHKR
jgi:hypothetical protein